MISYFLKKIKLSLFNEEKYKMEIKELKNQIKILELDYENLNKRFSNLIFVVNVHHQAITALNDDDDYDTHLLTTKSLNNNQKKTLN